MARLERQKSIHTLVQEQLEEEDENEDDEDPDPASWGHQIQGFTEDYHHRIVMHPSAPWRVNWDIFMLGMIVYVMLVAPFELTFISERMYKNNSNITLFVINRFVDFLFVVDFVMQFLTAYVDEKGQWVKHLLFDDQGVWKKSITCNYLTSWFFIDLISISRGGVWTCGKGGSCG